MSSFLYFIEQAAGPKPDLAAAGLAYAFDAAPQCSPLAGATPSGGPGLLVWQQSRMGNASPCYRKDDQVWRKAPRPAGTPDDRPVVWVGYYRDQPPGPANLARKQQIPGEPLVMGDGRPWLCPQLRAFRGSEGGFAVVLPTTPDLDDEGEWLLGEVRPEYRRLDAIADRLLEGMLKAELDEQPELRLQTAEALDLSAELLAANYAVSRVELAMLGVLRLDANTMDVVKAAVDFDTALRQALDQGDPAKNPPASAA